MDTNEDIQPTTGTLGIERWVQFAFIAGALLAFWFFDHLFADVAEFVALKANMPTPNPTLITAGSAILAIVTMAVAYRRPSTETWGNTVVVFVVSLVAAVIIGLFDAGWSAVTDLIY